jgi:carboxylesterase type B
MARIERPGSDRLTSHVATRSGRLEGETYGGGVRFRGIPFAKPPIGALRFRAPEPPDPWSGLRDARDFGPSAPQIGPVNRVIRSLIGAAGSRQSQDCLYLNVWTPKCDGARRPVMVWIHGGAFILGSGSTSLYAGERLATRGDVVVVTINYRLGALGFLSWKGFAPGSDVPPANLGLRDQIAALGWVRDNIEAFGGDPGNVTVFGESAGAMSIGTLLRCALRPRPLPQGDPPERRRPQRVDAREGRAGLGRVLRIARHRGSVPRRADGRTGRAADGGPGAGDPWESGSRTG